MKRIFWVVAFTLSSTVAQAQSFSSESTGADGAVTLAPCEARSLQVPDSGIFNFTTITIPGCGLGYPTSLAFTPNVRNTPVTIRALGDVVIDGAIVLDASGRAPGPGGFYGGRPAQPGFGPGGGAPQTTGNWVGPLSLVPAIGGSGGGGGCPDYPDPPRDSWGGGGGGAVVIASSTSITVAGAIYARGGDRSGCYSTSGAPSGPGSGGAIRLVANAITVSGRLEATGGADGLIRVEAPIAALSFTGLSFPTAVLSLINPTIVPIPTTAALTIASIGGFPVLSDAGVRPGTVDVVLPRGLTDPIPVVVQARNIPVGTQVRLNVTGSSGATYTQGSLAGSLALSTATLSVSGLDRTAESHLFVFATFDVPQSAALLNPSGPDHVAKVRVETAPGQPSTMAFLRRDGSVIDPKKISAALLQHLGYQKH
jgi:hypothetical protein